jgi:hypothetical protein
MPHGFAGAMFDMICRLSSDAYSNRQLQLYDLVDQLLLFMLLAEGAAHMRLSQALRMVRRRTQW